MQMNHEKCFPNAQKLKEMNDNELSVTFDWQQQLIDKWTQMTGIDSTYLTARLTQLCQNKHLANILYYLTLQLEDIDSAYLIQLLMSLQSMLTQSADAFEQTLKTMYLRFWFADFKALSANILKMNAGQFQLFNDDMEKHFGEQSLLTGKAMHLDTLFNYYVYLKNLTEKKLTDDVKSILLCAFVDQATRCGAGLIVLLNQQLMVVKEPKNLEQFLIQYSSSLVNSVSETFKAEVDVHQKNYIFTYARKLGYPTREEIDDPFIVPAFDNFQEIIDQLHVIYQQKYHFFGLLCYVIESLNEKLLMTWEYKGIHTEQTEKYSFSTAADIYAYIKKYLNVPQEISTDALKSLYVTQQIQTDIESIEDEDEVQFHIKGIEHHQLVIKLIERLVLEGIFVDQENWLEFLRDYFNPTSQILHLPNFENMFHLAHFIRLSPDYRREVELALIQRHFQHLPQEQWLDDVLVLLKILGDTKNIIPLLQELHQVHPFTHQLASVVPKFKNRLQQIHHQKSLIGPVFQCLGMMSDELLTELLTEKNEGGMSFLMSLVDEDSGYLDQVLSKIQILPKPQQLQIVTQLNPFEQNILFTALHKNISLFTKIFEWVLQYQPEALEMLLCQPDACGHHLLANAIHEDKAAACEPILLALEKYCVSDSGQWQTFFSVKNIFSNHILQMVLIDSPEHLPLLLMLLSRFNVLFQREVLSHCNREGENSLMLALKSYAINPEIYQQFVEYILSQPQSFCAQWFYQQDNAKQTVLTIASQLPVTMFNLIKQLFINLNPMERFIALNQIPVDVICHHPAVLELFQYLNTYEINRLCMKMDRTTNLSLINQLVLTQADDHVHQLLDLTPNLRLNLFASLDKYGQNILMNCLKLDDDHHDSFVFLLKELSYLELDNQLKILCHVNAASETLLSMCAAKSLNGMGFSDDEKSLVLTILDILIKAPETMFNFLNLIYNNYFLSEAQFLRLLKISDHIHSYYGHYHQVLWYLIDFMNTTQLEQNIPSISFLAILGHTSKSFRSRYYQHLLLSLDEQFESILLKEEKQVSKLFQLRFFLAQLGIKSSFKHWVNYLLQQSPGKSCRILSHTLDGEDSLLLYALTDFPRLGLLLTKHIINDPFFELLCFKPGINGRCIYTQLIELDSVELLQNKQLLKMANGYKLPILAMVFEKDGQFAEIFLEFFNSCQFSLKDKIDLLRFNLYFLCHYRRGFNHDGLVRFILSELVSLPLMSQEESLKFFDFHENGQSLFYLHYLIGITLRSSLSNMQYLLSFIDKHHQAERLNLIDDSISVLHAALGISEENYHCWMTYLQEKINLPGLLLAICQKTDLLDIVLQKQNNLDFKRLFNQLIHNLPANAVWALFLRPSDEEQLSPLVFLSYREELQAEFFAYFRSQGIQIDADVSAAMLANPKFDKCKGVSILKMCSYLSADTQLSLFSQLGFLKRYASKYYNLQDFPLVLNQVMTFDEPVILCILRDFSWPTIFLKSNLESEHYLEFFNWLGRQSVGICYVFLKKQALQAAINSTCDFSLIDGLLNMLTPTLRQEIIHECLQAFDEQTLSENPRLLKLQQRLACMGSDSMYRFFSDNTSSNTSFGPSPM